MRRTFAFVVAALALSACTVGPSFERPAPTTLAGYRMAGDAAPSGPAAQTLTVGDGPAGPWWRAFGSPALDRTVAQALADNASLASADATLAQAQEAVAAAEGQRRPQFDVTAGITRERANLASFGVNFGLPNPTFSLYSLGGQVAYPLDLFGGRRRQVETVAAQAETQGRRRDAAALTLTGEVARQALTVAALRAQLQAVEAIVADDQRTLDLTRRAFAAGGAPREQTVNATSQLAADAVLAAPLRQQLAAARHQLALLVGQAPAAWTPPDFQLADFRLPASVPVALPSALVRRRPDILQAEANLHAAAAEIGVRTAALYPDITLSASVAQAALEPASLFSSNFQGWSFGAGLTAPIFHGGTLRAQKRASVDAANAALADYRQTVLSAFTQVADVMQALAVDADQITAEQRAAASAEESVKLARLAYREGGRDLLQLIDAERQSSRARLELVRAQAQQYLDTAALFVATAADWTGQGEAAVAVAQPPAASMAASSAAREKVAPSAPKVAVTLPARSST